MDGSVGERVSDWADKRAGGRGGGRWKRGEGAPVAEMRSRAGRWVIRWLGPWTGRRAGGQVNARLAGEAGSRAYGWLVGWQGAQQT